MNIILIYMTWGVAALSSQQTHQKNQQCCAEHGETPRRTRDNVNGCQVMSMQNAGCPVIFTDYSTSAGWRDLSANWRSQSWQAELQHAGRFFHARRANSSSEINLRPVLPHLSHNSTPLRCQYCKIIIHKKNTSINKKKSHLALLLHHAGLIWSLQPDPQRVPGKLLKNQWKSTWTKHNKTISIITILYRVCYVLNVGEVHAVVVTLPS